MESRSSLGIAPGVSFSTASGARFHYATASDIELMKETIGVRDPERDYNIIQGQFGTGLAPPTEEAWDSMIGSSLILESLPQGPSAPASYDLSTQPYFPAVGNQGGQGSCGAWAATYYCYGYTEAKDQGWTDAKTGNTAHLVSPPWTYNRVNGGVDHGSWMDENMNIIVDWGVPSMQAMPYNDHDLLNWGSPAAFREAPLHRALSTVAIPYYGDTTINQIKDLVSSDKPVTFAFNADGFSGLNDGDGIISALEYPATDINHAQTIVGYNDSISEDGDVGAFRVVNSWGTSDGYTDHGYYWFTYNALKEIGDAAGLCYIEDRVDYNPRLLAVWHFNAQPSRSNYFTVGIGNPSAPAGERSPLFSGDSNSAHRQPVFMCLDITDFNSTYNLGTNSFFLKYLATSVSGVISSFRVEMYEPSYISGAATQISPQSSNVPKTTPNTVTVSFPYHAQIGYDEGLDTSGYTYSSTSLSKWVGVDHRSIYGGDALQSGDTANSDESSISTTVTGPGAVGFYWRVSSEANKDYLNVYLDDIKQTSISGSVDWRQQVVALMAGAHTIRWSYAKDSANSSGEDAGYVDRLRIDLVAPQSTATATGDGQGGWFNRTVNVTLQSTDTQSGVNFTLYRIDNGSWLTYSLPFDVGGDGGHEVEFFAVDMAGNQESVQSLSIKIDTQAPTSSALASGSEGLAGWYVSAVVMQLQSVDLSSGLVNISYSLDGGPLANYSQPLTVSLPGEHTMNYYAQDQAGNLETTKSISFRIDTGKPQSSNTLTGPMGSEQWYLEEVSINLSASDSVSGVLRLDYRVDGGEWLAFHNVVGVASEGDHELEYRALDRAGNVEMTNALSFRIDSSAPSLELSAGNARHSTSGSLRVAWTSADQVSSLLQVEVSVDGKEYAVVAPGEKELEIKNLGDGKHTVSLRSTDVAGNSVIASYEITVDTNPLSPDGPLGPWLLVTLGALAVAAVGLIFWRRRK